MATTKSKEYDASSIKHLGYVESVRQKPTLYIGSTDSDGVFRNEMSSDASELLRVHSHTKEFRRNMFDGRLGLFSCIEEHFVSGNTLQALQKVASGLFCVACGLKTYIVGPPYCKACASTLDASVLRRMWWRPPPDNVVGSSEDAALLEVRALLDRETFNRHNRLTLSKLKANVSAPGYKTLFNLVADENNLASFFRSKLGLSQKPGVRRLSVRPRLCSSEIRLEDFRLQKAVTYAWSKLRSAISIKEPHLISAGLSLANVTRLRELTRYDDAGPGAALNILRNDLTCPYCSSVGRLSWSSFPSVGAPCLACREDASVRSQRSLDRLRITAKSLATKKEHVIHGRVFWLRGYESQFLRQLVSKDKIHQVKADGELDWLRLDDGSRWLPDFLLGRTLVEIKSPWTLLGRNSRALTRNRLKNALYPEVVWYVGKPLSQDKTQLSFTKLPTKWHAMSDISLQAYL